MEITLEVDGWRKNVVVSENVLNAGFFEFEPPMASEPIRLTATSGQRPKKPTSYRLFRFYRVPNNSNCPLPLFRAG